MSRICDIEFETYTTWAENAILFSFQQIPFYFSEVSVFIYYWVQ